MSILAWLILGLLSGFIGSKIVNRRGEGVLVDIVLGIVGAVVGGFLFTQIGVRGVTGLNLWSILVAALGSVLVLTVFHAFAPALNRGAALIDVDVLATWLPHGPSERSPIRRVDRPGFPLGDAGERRRR